MSTSDRAGLSGIPFRGGLKYDDYTALNKLRSEAKRHALMLSTYPINFVLAEADAASGPFERAEAPGPPAQGRTGGASTRDPDAALAALYERCVDAECEVAYAYGEAAHWHYRGPQRA